MRLLEVWNAGDPPRHGGKPLCATSDATGAQSVENPARKT